MNLFIQIRNGQPFEHPIFEDNFKEAFPEIDVNNLPSNFARFVRIEQPKLGPYEKNQSLSYEWSGDVIQDVWRCEQMTVEEKQSKIAQVQNEPHFESWVFNEEFCRWDSPVPYPSDGRRYKWDESTTSWEEIASV